MQKMKLPGLFAGLLYSLFYVKSPGHNYKQHLISNQKLSNLNLSQG